MLQKEIPRGRFTTGQRAAAWLDLTKTPKTLRIKSSGHNSTHAAHLLSSGLLPSAPACTGSTARAARGLDELVLQARTYRRSGISPCPEGGFANQNYRRFDQTVKQRAFGPAILNMAVFAENFQNYRRKIGPRGSETSKTHCETKLFARRWSIFRIAAFGQGAALSSISEKNSAPRCNCDALLCQAYNT
jgi:hypothetical protein